jgi:hypothetical protein
MKSYEHAQKVKQFPYGLNSSAYRLPLEFYYKATYGERIAGHSTF